MIVNHEQALTGTGLLSKLSIHRTGLVLSVVDYETLSQLGTSIKTHCTLFACGVVICHGKCRID